MIRRFDGTMGAPRDGQLEERELTPTPNDIISDGFDARGPAK